MSPPKMHMLKANPQHDGLWRWGLWEVLRSWGWSSHAWGSALIKGTWRALSLPTMWGSNKKSAVWKPSLELAQAATCFPLLAPRIVRNEWCWLVISHPASGICDSNPKGLWQQANALIQTELTNSHSDCSPKSGCVIEIHISTTGQCYQGDNSSPCSFQPEDHGQQLSTKGVDGTSPRQPQYDWLYFQKMPILWFHVGFWPLALPIKGGFYVPGLLSPKCPAEIAPCVFPGEVTGRIQLPPAFLSGHLSLEPSRHTGRSPRLHRETIVS